MGTLFQDRVNNIIETELISACKIIKIKIRQLLQEKKIRLIRFNDIIQHTGIFKVYLLPDNRDVRINIIKDNKSTSTNLILRPQNNLKLKKYSLKQYMLEEILENYPKSLISEDSD